MTNTQPAITSPITPPADESKLSTVRPSTESSRKPSVTFDLSNLPETPQNDDILSPSLSASPTSGIHAQAVPDSILVALIDRQEEMRELVRYNHRFFATVRARLRSEWPNFEKNILYASREQMPDREWMQQISQALNDFPSLYLQFCDLVGYVDPDHYQQLDATNEDFADVDITRIRDYPHRLAQLPESYPQLFINCQACLESPSYNCEYKRPYDTFKRTLLAPRSELPDDLWEMIIYDILDPWPNCLDQLKEIIAYEIECGEEDQHKP